MSRFIRQRDKYSCGPVAILNAMRSLGKDAPYSMLRQIRKDVGCVSKGKLAGTCSNRLGQGLRKYIGRQATIRKVKNITLSSLDKHLQEGGTAVLNYYFMHSKFKEYRGHFSFFAGKKDEYFIAVNRHPKGKAARLTHRDALKIWEFKRGSPRCHAWLIKPRKV